MSDPPKWPYTIIGGADYTSEPPCPPLPFIPAHEVKPSLDDDDFVEGLLTGGSLSVVYGAPKAGKTFFVLDLALHVACGMRWNDRDVDLGGVLYLALEGGNGIDKRVYAWMQHHQMGNLQIPFALVKLPLNLRTQNGDCEAVIQTTRHVAARLGHPVKLIVIDTLARAMSGGDENTSSDMGAVISVADAIRQDSQAHVMFIHHPGKDSARGPRGSTSLPAAIDAQIEVTAEGDDRQAHVIFQRDLASGDVIRFKLDVIHLGKNRRGKPVTSCVSIVAKKGSPEASSRNQVKHITGDVRSAYEVLCNVLAANGKRGFSGTPDGIHSVPERLWRDQFYQGPKAGDEQQTQRRAFQRARDKLIELRIIAMNEGRAWLTARDQDGT